MRMNDRWTCLAAALGLMLPASYVAAQSEVADETVLKSESRDKPSPPQSDNDVEADGEAAATDEMREATDAVVVTQGDLEGEMPDDGFDSDKERRSYAIGMNIAQSFDQGGLDIDPEIVAEGLLDQANGDELRLTQESAESVLMVLQQEMMAKQQQMR